MPKVIIWTTTTDGDNCPLTTTVHLDEMSACRRVLDDLIYSRKQWPKDDPPKSELVRKAWGDAMDGSCIIESHEIEIAP